MADPNTSFQEQVAALRRAQILDAATKVFAARGFHRTTIRDIAKQAGIADGTIYNYFENKTALLLGILNRMNETERRKDDFALSTDMDLRAFVQAYLRHRFAVLAPDGLEIFQVILSEVLVDAELRELYVQQIVEPTFALVEPFFTQLVEQGKIPVIDVPLTLRVMSAMFLGVLMLRILGDSQIQAKWDELPDLLTTIMLGSLAPGQGA